MSEYPNASKFPIIQDHKKDEGRVSGLSRISKQLLKAHYDGYRSCMSRQLALAIKRYIDRKPRYERTTIEFVGEIHRNLLCLHEYNLQVAQVKKYPKSKQLDQLLIRYIELECEVLYGRRGEVAKTHEDSVESRVFRLIQVILSNATQNTESTTKITRDVCLKVILKLFVNVRADCVTENRLVRNVLVKLVDKMGHLAEIQALRGKNIGCHQDTLLSDPRTLRLRQYLTTSDYETNDSDSEDESDFESSDIVNFLNKGVFKPGFSDSGSKNVITIELTDDEDHAPPVNSFKTNGGLYREIKVEFSDESNSSRSGNVVPQIANSNHRHIETVSNTKKNGEEHFINSWRFGSGRKFNEVAPFPKSSNKDLGHSANKQCSSTQDLQNRPQITGRNDVEATFLHLEPKIEVDVYETERLSSAIPCQIQNGNLPGASSSLHSHNADGAVVQATLPHPRNNLVTVDNAGNVTIEILDDDDDEINYGDKESEPSSLNQIGPIKLEENEENHSPNFAVSNSEDVDQQQLLTSAPTKESGSSVLDLIDNSAGQSSEKTECGEVAVQPKKDGVVENSCDDLTLLPTTDSVCDDSTIPPNGETALRLNETSIDKEAVEIQPTNKQLGSGESASESPNFDCSETVEVEIVQKSQNDALIEDFDSSKIQSAPPLTEPSEIAEVQQQTLSENFESNLIDGDLRVDSEEVVQSTTSAQKHQDETSDADEASKTPNDNTFILSETDKGHQVSSLVVEDAAVTNSSSPDAGTEPVELFENEPPQGDSPEVSYTNKLRDSPEVSDTNKLHFSQEDEISFDDHQETEPEVLPITPTQSENMQTIVEEIINTEEVEVSFEEVEVTVATSSEDSLSVCLDTGVTSDKALENSVSDSVDLHADNDELETTKVIEETVLEETIQVDSAEAVASFKDSSATYDDLNVAKGLEEETVATEECSGSEVQDVVEEKLTEETEDVTTLPETAVSQDLEAAAKMEVISKETEESVSLCEKAASNEVFAPLETIVEDPEEVAAVSQPEVPDKESENSDDIPECSHMSPHMISQEVEVETSTVDEYSFADAAYDTQKKADALVFFANVAASQEVLAVKTETPKPVTSRTRSIEKSGTDKKITTRKTLQRAVKQKKQTKMATLPLEENKRNTRSATSRRESREASKSPRANQNSETKFRPYEFVFAQDTSPPPTNNVYDQKPETNLTSEDSNDSCGLIIDLKLEKEKEADKSYNYCFDEETIDDLLEFVATENKAPVVCISIPESDNYTESNAILKQMEAFVDGATKIEDVELNEITTVHKKFNRAKYIKNMGFSSSGAESSQLEETSDPDSTVRDQEVGVLAEVKFEATPPKKTDHSIATILKTPSADPQSATNEISGDSSNTVVSGDLLDLSTKPKEIIKEAPMEITREEEIPGTSTDEFSSPSSLSKSFNSSQSEDVSPLNDSSSSSELPHYSFDVDMEDTQVRGEDVCERSFKSKGALKSFDQLEQPVVMQKQVDKKSRARVRSKSLNENKERQPERKTAKDDMSITSKTLRVTLDLLNGDREGLVEKRLETVVEKESEPEPAIVNAEDSEQRLEKSTISISVDAEEGAISNVSSEESKLESDDGTKAEQIEFEEVVEHDKPNVVEDLPSPLQKKLISLETGGSDLEKATVESSNLPIAESQNDRRRRRKQLFTSSHDSETVPEVTECAEIVLTDVPLQKDTSALLEPINEVSVVSVKCANDLEKTPPVIIKNTKPGKSVDASSIDTCPVTNKVQEKEKGLENAIKKIKEIKEKALSQQPETPADGLIESKTAIDETSKSRSRSIEKRDKRDSKSIGKDKETRRSSSKPRSSDKTRSDKDKERKRRSRSSSKSRTLDKKSSEGRRSDEHKDGKMRSRSSSKSKSLDKKIGGEKSEELKRSSSRASDKKSGQKEGEKRDSDRKPRSRSSSKAKSLDGASRHERRRSRSSSKSKSVDGKTKHDRKSHSRSLSKPKSLDSKNSPVKVDEVPSNTHRKRSRSTTEEVTSRTKRGKHEDKERDKNTLPSGSKEQQTKSDEVERSKVKLHDEDKKVKSELKTKEKESEKSRLKSGESNEEKNFEKSRSKEKDTERGRIKTTDQNKEMDIKKSRSKDKDKSNEINACKKDADENKEKDDSISRCKEVKQNKGRTAEQSRNANIEQFIESYIRRSRSREKDQCKEKTVENAIEDKCQIKDKGIEKDVESNTPLEAVKRNSKEKCHVKIEKLRGKSKDQNEEKVVETANDIEASKEEVKKSSNKEKCQVKGNEIEKTRSKRKDQNEGQCVEKARDKDAEPKKRNEDAKSGCKEKSQVKERNIGKTRNEDKDKNEKVRNKNIEPNKEDQVEKVSIEESGQLKEDKSRGEKLDRTEGNNIGRICGKDFETVTGKSGSNEKFQIEEAKGLEKPGSSSKGRNKEKNFRSSELGQNKIKNVEKSTSEDTNQNRQKDVARFCSKDKARTEKKDDFKNESSDPEPGNLLKEEIKSNEEQTLKPGENKIKGGSGQADKYGESHNITSRVRQMSVEALDLDSSIKPQQHYGKNEEIAESRIEAENDNKKIETDDEAQKKLRKSNSDENRSHESKSERKEEKAEELKFVGSSVDINKNCEKRRDRNSLPKCAEELVSKEENPGSAKNSRKPDNSDFEDDYLAKKPKLHDRSPMESEITLPIEIPQKSGIEPKSTPADSDVSSSSVESLQTSSTELSLVEKSLGTNREIVIPSVIVAEPALQKPVEVFDPQEIAIPPRNILDETEKRDRGVIPNHMLAFGESQIVPYVNPDIIVGASETVVEPACSELIESCSTILTPSSSMKLEPLLRNAISSVTSSAEQVFVSSTYSSFVLSGTVNETCKTTTSTDPPLLPTPNQPKAVSIHCGIITQSVNIVNASIPSTVIQEDKSCLYTYNEETIISPTKLGIGSNQSLDLIPPSASIPEITGGINLESLVLNNINEDSGEADNVANYDPDSGSKPVGGPMVSGRGGRGNEQKPIPTDLTRSESPVEFNTLPLDFTFTDIGCLDEYPYPCKTEKPDFDSNNDFSIMHPDVSASKPDDISPPSHLDLVEPQSDGSKNSGIDASLDSENGAYASLTKATDFAINKLLKLTEDVGTNSLAPLPDIDHINIMEPSKESLEDPVPNVPLCDPPTTTSSYQSFLSKESNEQKVVVEQIEQFPVNLPDLKDDFIKQTSEAPAKVPDIKRSVEARKSVAKLSPPSNKVDSKMGENPLLKVDMEKLTGRRHSRTPVATSTPKNASTQQKSTRAPYKIPCNTSAASADRDTKTKPLKSLSELLDIPGAINSNLASRLRLRKDLIQSTVDSGLDSILEGNDRATASEVTAAQNRKSSPRERHHWSESKSNDPDIESTRKRKYDEKVRQDKRRKSQETENKDTDTIFNELLKQGPTNKFFPLPSGNLADSRSRNDGVTSETSRHVDHLGTSSHRSAYSRPSGITSRESARFLENDQRRDVRRQSHYLNNVATNRRLGERKHQNDHLLEGSSRSRVSGNSSRNDLNSSQSYVRPQDRRLNAEQLKNLTPNKTVTNPKFREQNEDEHLWRKKISSVLDIDEGLNLFSPPKNKNRDMSP